MPGERHRDHLPDGIRRPRVRRYGGGARGPGRHGGAANGSRSGRGAGARPVRRPRARLRGARPGEPVLPAPAPGALGAHPGGRVPEVPRGDGRVRGAVRARIRAARLGGAEVVARRRGRGRARARRPRHPPGHGRALRSVPGPGDVPDPRSPGAGRRVRRPDHRRRGAEVPQLAGGAGVPQGPGALRPVPGAARPGGPALPARGGGRLHGRRGRRPVRHRLRGGDPRDGGDPRPSSRALPFHAGGRVLLRRRRRGARCGLAGSGAGAAPHARRPAGVVSLPA